jgi:hypothetical protein
MAKHFIVQLQNRPGALAHLVRALAARGVNITRVASGGHGPYAFASLETNDFAATHEVLKGIGLEFVEGESLVVLLRDEPGTLAALTIRLADEGVNVESVMTVGRCDGDVELALVVDDAAKAREIIGSDRVLTT